MSNRSVTDSTSSFKIKGVRCSGLTVISRAAGKEKELTRENISGTILCDGKVRQKRAG
jgi:hypothetical protein